MAGHTDHRRIVQTARASRIARRDALVTLRDTRLPSRQTDPSHPASRATPDPAPRP